MCFRNILMVHIICCSVLPHPRLSSPSAPLLSSPSLLPSGAPSQVIFPGARLGGRSTRGLLTMQWSIPSRLELPGGGAAAGELHPSTMILAISNHSMNSAPERDWHPPRGRFTHRKLQLCVITRGPVTNAFLVEYVSQSGRGCPLRVAKWSALS